MGVKLTIILIKIYQASISPLFKPCCRFTPTCSEYMIESVKKKGPVKGVVKGLWRVLRCNPLGGEGYDPVK